MKIQSKSQTEGKGIKNWIIKKLGGYTEKPKTKYKTKTEYIRIFNHSVIWVKDGVVYEEKIDNLEEVFKTLERLKTDLGITSDDIRNFAQRAVINQL